MLFIPKEQVQYIETKFGSHAERPMVQMIAGLLLSRSVLSVCIWH